MLKKENIIPIKVSRNRIFGARLFNVGSRVKNKRIVFKILLILVLIIITAFNVYPKYSEKLRWSQEYIIGKEGIKGEVDVTIFDSNLAYEIGANKNGYAVFKNPDLALKQSKIDYADAINNIKKEYYLANLSKLNYKKYKTWGWQLSTNDEKIVKQGNELTAFLDIYENSFK